MFSKTPILKDRKYLDWLREQPCALSGRTNQNDPAHIGTGGMGLKTHDFETLPLDHELHMVQEGQRGTRSGFLAALLVLPPEEAEFGLRELLRDAGAFRYLMYKIGEPSRYHAVMKLKGKR